jgi:large subunit ribosomal protein L31
MKEEIHPKWYPEARVTCACGNTWITGSTVPEIRTDVCSNCHPFYTGEQRIVDTEGQVDRFMKRLEARDSILAAAERTEAQSLPDLPISELELGTRYEKAFAEAGFETAGDILDVLEEGGDEALLAIKGVGRKAVIDVKRSMRALGYTLPKAE